MNNSEYLQYLQQRMGKVGESGMKYLTPRMLDRAYGGEQLSRQFGLQKIGMQDDLNQRRVGLSQDRAALSQKRMGQEYDTSRSTFKDAEGAMDTAHLFDLAGLGVGYLQGQNQANRSREMADMIRRQTKAIEGIAR